MTAPTRLPDKLPAEPRASMPNNVREPHSWAHG
jgi:hypothetical protein